MDEKFPIVKSRDGSLYYYNGSREEDKYEFENIATGKVGIISKEQSENLFGFVVPFALNMIAAQFPEVLNMIKKLNLRI